VHAILIFVFLFPSLAPPMRVEGGKKGDKGPFKSKEWGKSEKKETHR